MRSYGEEPSEPATRVTRSIMIVKPPGYQSGSPPASPAGSVTPVSPFSGKVVIQLFVFLYIYCTLFLRQLNLSSKFTESITVKVLLNFGQGKFVFMRNGLTFKILIDNLIITVLGWGSYDIIECENDVLYLRINSTLVANKQLLLHG